MHVLCPGFRIMIKKGCQNENHCWKFGQKTKLVCFDIQIRLFTYLIFFLGLKLFLFFKIESWKFSASVWKRISWNLKKFQLIQLIQTIFIFSLSCLIELKFCEDSRNSFSNRCWKCQLSIYAFRTTYLIGTPK